MDSQLPQGMQNRGVEQETDTVLVDRCRAGDQRAFEELMKRYHTPAMKVALSIIRERQDAQDEVQNAFWKAYEHIGRFNGEAKFSTWLTRIVVNQCLMHLRKDRRAKFTYLDDTPANDEQITLELPDYRQTPEQLLGKIQVADVLYEEIRRTPRLLRNVFLLRDVEQRPMTEVAGILGISVAAAKSRLLRARAELRNRMQKHFGAVGPATLMR